ncbi:hypothetical protein MKW98_023293 [Papaver atlanticum]|uniref:Small RNA 2'-O-methyltransferase n=1 Tax=Papaver atlanticum TaxID=357466 RepID=A0AAD4XVF8_9MAGN|nr:hypothetical protein MKW98_023293 [Papaver atlanticum]
MTVASEVCKRKKDAEQSAARIAIVKLGIQSIATSGLTVKELSDELVTRVSYAFSDKRSSQGFSSCVYSCCIIEVVINGNPSEESICVEAIRIPCSLQKPFQPLSFNISSKEYYADVIAEKLGVADASHFHLSRTIGKSSSEMRLNFLRWAFHWILIQNWMLVGRLPDGGYKLSRDAIIAADLPTAFTTLTNWRGSYLRDLLSTFCRLHWLPEPEFSKTCLDDSIQSPMKKQKLDQKKSISKPVKETANGGAVVANSGEVIMGSGATFKCDVKIVSTNHDVIMEYSPGDCYKMQGATVQSTSLKVLLWLNKYFKQLDIPIENCLSSENNALGVRVYPKVFSKEFAICLLVHTAQLDSFLSKCSMGILNRVEELVEMNWHYNIVSPPKIEAGGSAMPISLPSLKDYVLKYSINLLRVQEPLKDQMEQALFVPPLSKQRVKYAVKYINESCALVDFGCRIYRSGALLDSLLDYPTSLETIVGVDISRKNLTHAAKVFHLD